MSTTRLDHLEPVDSANGMGAGTKAFDVSASQVILHVLIAVAALLWLELNGGNRLIADRLFAWEGGQWLLKDHFITSVLVHQVGKYLSMMMWLATVASWWIVRRKKELITWHRPLLYLWIATLASTVLVSALQSLTALDCPWDLVNYGGSRPYYGLFDARPAGLHDSGCFPSGHASAGYCWVALYFFCASVAPRWRRTGLVFGLALGGIFGISQQLRGAHFASHDVATLLTCWLTAVTLHFALRPRTDAGH
ncbi:MAG: hypothetical protein IPK97_06660 [Ahniella sp.]|nr:hypothetical protein [Ahniella sp.]